jgi:hypothetical protein
MAMKYTKVLDLMRRKGGRVEITDPELATVLGDYKAVGAMSDIRRFAKLEVRTVREGRKAVAYELVATTPVVDAPEAPVTSDVPAV